MYFLTFAKHNTLHKLMHVARTRKRALHRQTSLLRPTSRPEPKSSWPIVKPGIRHLSYLYTRQAGWKPLATLRAGQVRRFVQVNRRNRGNTPVCIHTDEL